MAIHGLSTPSLLAVATGVIGSAWAAGNIASFTLFGAPVAQSFSGSTAQIWHALYVRGMAVMPKVAVTVGLAYGYAAYESHSRGVAWKGFLGAAGLVIAIVPFTLIVMASTNGALTQFAKGASTLTAADESHLVSKWAVMNFVRSLLPLAGAVTGLATFLNNIS